MTLNDNSVNYDFDILGILIILIIVLFTRIN